ncbi:MAG: SPOR domain-containing protein [Rubrivivax sp.]
MLRRPTWSPRRRRRPPRSPCRRPSPPPRRSRRRSRREAGCRAGGPGSHYVQLGAFQHARAEADWRTLQARHAAELAGLKPHYAAGKSQGKPVVRLQVGVASEQRAEALCASLKKHGQACVAVH